MGRRRKTEEQVIADKKGEARMRRYEESQEEVVVPKAGERTVTFWEKIGENGDWEEKEYIVKKEKV